MKPLKLATLSAAVALATAVFAPISLAAEAELSLSDADFEHAKTLYFQRCAGCHGVLRKGATGKNLEPINTIKKGQKRLEKILTYGTEGGMNNFNDIFTKDEIKMMATYIQLEPPVPPEMSLELMQSRTKVYLDPKDYPTEPQHDRNWENFFVVIERDAGKVAIIDGDTHEIYAHLDAGYAVHVIKGQEHHNVDKSNDVAGRFWYSIGRDGKLNKFDLWQTPDKMLVAETQIAYDARDVAVSGDGKYVIAGGYWPPHFVITDAETMKPVKVVSTRGMNIDGEYVEESRVAAIYTNPNESSFLLATKELGQMWQVGYKDLDALSIKQINSAKFLHDGFYDPTGRYFQVAANASKKMVIIDTKDGGSLEAMIDVANLPHPGPGANWIDPKCGPVAGTTHLGVGLVSVWGNDPEGHPDQAWKMCYEVETDGAGAFIRTHENSDYYWADQLKHPEQEVQQSVQVISKKTREIVKTIRVTEEEGKVALHMEFNKGGTEVWVSVWNRTDASNPTGEIVIYDAKTLEEIDRIKGLTTPTGKFNVYNRVHHKT